MGTGRRDTWGLRCVHAGAGLRWAAACLAGSVVACVALGLPAMWLLGRAYPSPFGLLAGGGHAASAGGWCLQGAAVALACFLALRVAAVAVTVAAWLLASPELRLALAGGPRDVRAQSAKNHCLHGASALVRVTRSCTEVGKEREWNRPSGSRASARPRA